MANILRSPFLVLLDRAASFLFWGVRESQVKNQQKMSPIFGLSAYHHGDSCPRSHLLCKYIATKTLFLGNFEQILLTPFSRISLNHFL